ncbi:MAG: hypothetical protein LBN02_01590 [Oscillospiraceae bacterium]|jgi:hypothetical protein|nr:hypothetical protein [Oscillospiraceae bacterium]
MQDLEYLGGTPSNPPSNNNEPDGVYACPALGTHYALVGVPVTVKPFAYVGRISVECSDQPFMEQTNQIRGKVGASCHFTIAQMLRIDIPVDFGASVRVGETFVECDRFGVESNNEGGGRPNPHPHALPTPVSQSPSEYPPSF